MKIAGSLLVLACFWFGPAVASEAWRCGGQNYTIESRYIARDEPPLIYKLVENNAVSAVGILPYVPTDGMAVFLLRKSDGALLKFSAGLPDKGSKKGGLAASSQIEHCQKR